MRKSEVIVVGVSLILCAVLVGLAWFRTTRLTQEELRTRFEEQQRPPDPAKPAAPPDKPPDNQQPEPNKEAAEPAPETADQAKTPEPKPAPKPVPDVFKVKFECTNGTFVAEFHKDWAPLGVARVHELVSSGFYADAAFFRVVGGFVVQFGIAGNPQINAEWRQKKIKDDPVKQSNVRGTISFAAGGKNTRTTQLFINLVDNSALLDGTGFAPVGKVIEGMEEVVDKLYKGYGEGGPNGRGPDQMRINTQGNDYLKRSFPKLDYVKTATIIEDAEGSGKPASDGAPPAETGETNKDG